MLVEVNRKLLQLRQSVLLHQKYIEKFDALSLSSLEYDERSNKFIFPPSISSSGTEQTGLAPELRGLHGLVKEVNDILNEGHIAQQSLLNHIGNEVEACVKIQTMISDHRSGILHAANIQHQLQILIQTSHGEAPLLDFESSPSPTTESDCSDHDYSSLPLAPGDVLPIENFDKVSYLESSSKHSTSNHRKRQKGSTQQLQRVEISLLEKEVRSRLKHLYESISELLEDKLILLRMVQDISDYYESSIGDLGERSGVLHVNEKLQLLVCPFLKPLLAHKIFNVQEEVLMLSNVKKSWASLYLGNQSHEQLANEDLNRRVSSLLVAVFRLIRSLPQVLIKSKTHEDWTFYIKIGAGIVFLFWSLSECFNNEIAKSHIWNVSARSVAPSPHL